MLDKAIRIAAQAFEGKFDKGGQPYILHCLQVMYDTKTDDVDVKCAAVRMWRNELGLKCLQVNWGNF